MNQERLEELESRVAFQEDAIDQLNDALVQQDLRINRLEAAVGRLEKLFQDLASAMPARRQR